MTAPHSLPCAEGLLPRLIEACRAGRLALFLDFDGTLTPIVDHPDLARLDPAVAASLARLATRAFVAVVSGRDLADIRARVGIPGLWYAGSHGLDIEGPDGRRLVVGSEVAEELAALADELAPSVAATPGAWLERKRLSLAVHVRASPPQAAAALGEEVRRQAAHRPRVRLLEGKKIFDLKPAVDWHKGRAVRWLLEEVAPADALPVFLGDDVTDEDAFAELGDEGITILVGDGRPATRARFRLVDTAAVAQFLARLAEGCAPQISGTGDRTAR